MGGPALTDLDPPSPKSPTPPRLKKRAEFLACAKGPSCARGAVVIQALPQPARTDLAVGFTATKRIGNAVIRNRAKRRLREAARLLLPQFGRPAHDYVFIARQGADQRPWPRLLDDVKSALIRLAAEDGARDPGKRRAGSSAPSPLPAATPDPTSTPQKPEPTSSD
jgi:ribonuclease P protein component